MSAYTDILKQKKDSGRQEVTLAQPNKSGPKSKPVKKQNGKKK